MKVKMPKDIAKYEDKVVWVFTLRQFIFLCIGIGIFIASFSVLGNVLPTTTLSFVCVMLAMPVIFVGFVKVNGIYVEEIIKIMYLSEFKNYYLRLYKPERTDNEKK